MGDYYREIKHPNEKLLLIKEQALKKYKADKQLKRKVVNEEIKKKAAPFIHKYIKEQSGSFNDEKVHWLKQGPTTHHNNGLERYRKIQKVKYPVIVNTYAYLIAYLIFFILLISGLVTIEQQPEIGGALAGSGGGGIIITSVVGATEGRYSPIDKYYEEHFYCFEVVRCLNINDKGYKIQAYFKNGKPKKKGMREGYNNLYKTYVLDESSIESRKNDFSKPKPITSNNFKSLGGVYAWLVNGEVVYIGKANNIQRRMKEHSRKLIAQTGPKKYRQGFNVNTVMAQELAITNISEEQTVMESYFYWKMGEPYLNSCVPMTLQKIQTTPKYREIMSRLTD